MWNPPTYNTVCLKTSRSFNRERQRRRGRAERDSIVTQENIEVNRLLFFNRLFSFPLSVAKNREGVTEGAGRSEAKMPTESRILEQRIRQLESEVRELIAHPRDEHARRLPNIGEVSHSIRRRINFLRTLLFAEKYETQTQAVKKLNHMNTRLANLESNFANWVDSHNPGEGDGEHDTSSSCSCTHSCVNGGNGEEDCCEEVAVERADHHLLGEHGWFEADLGLEQYELLGKAEAGEEKTGQLQCELPGKEEAGEEDSGHKRRSLLSAFKKGMGVMHVGLGVMLAYAIFCFFGLYGIENSIYPIPT